MDRTLAEVFLKLKSEWSNINPTIPIYADKTLYVAFGSCNAVYHLINVQLDRLTS
jgi:hypothetical protein